MTPIRVWAPYARHVELEAGGRRHPMSREADGWWRADDELAAGTDYAFSLDGGDPLPDPRSPWQPHGVHGTSRVVDHDEFEWTDGGFRPPPLASAVIYELHVGTFSREGTFDGVIEGLGYLQDLGVTHIELLPVHAFPGNRGWGYDGVALFAPHEAYGGPEGLKRLVDACHEHGLAVLLDVVYNHLGPDGNYLGHFGPYFTDRYRTPWGDAVNLDGPDSDPVRRFLCDNACMWLRDYHIDGLRIDAIHAFHDRSATHVLEQLTGEVDALSAELGKEHVLIAESDLNDPRIVRGREAGGYGVHAQWSDDLHHALHAAMTEERQGYYADFGSLADVAKALEHVFVNDGRYSPFRRRSHGRPPTGVPASRFLGYLQTHDQVGNRARGDRIGHLVPSGRAMAAAALVLGGPHVPLLFQGEEWNASAPFLYFTDHRDPELAEAVRKGRRQEFAAFGWSSEDVPDPQAHETCERSRLDWHDLEQPRQRMMLRWYRSLIELRHRRPDLTHGPVRVRYDEQARWLAMERRHTSVICNFGTETHSVGLDPDRSGQVLLRSHDDISVTRRTVRLPPDSVAVIA